jgi:TPP-dependent indolepyruvate ferredoxin oxidoreductase alpha subunit
VEEVVDLVMVVEEVLEVIELQLKQLVVGTVITVTVGDGGAGSKLSWC